MNIGSSLPPSIGIDMPASADEAEVAGKLLEMNQSQTKQTGAAALKLIEDAGVNKPLTEGHIGRRINVGV